MNAAQRIQQAVQATVDRAASAGCPPRLGAALRHAVFPGGARLRPRLCLAVAAACGEDDPATTEAAAVAVELLHCASLVHDDMPCFDDAETRRGKPSVHRAFGDDIALLTGDTLIVLAFEALARSGGADAARVVRLTGIVARAVGAPSGIAAGQAWECEPKVVLTDYHRAKTGALFAAATEAGAVSAGGDGDAWRDLGARLGEAYQIADDLKDACGSAAELGKPVGQDETHNRPSAVRELGLPAAVDRLKASIETAISCIPPCPRAGDLAVLIEMESKRFLPSEISRAAA